MNPKSTGSVAIPQWKELWPNGVVLWGPVNIYPTADLGEDVSVGQFSEVGAHVTVGRKTRIGAHCFIPEGVSIGEGVFIGPGVVMTNDRFPPSSRNAWEKTVIEDFARIGAGCVILPGVTIGRYALVGAGSVVTKSVPAGETWYGNPASRDGARSRRREFCPYLIAGALALALGISLICLLAR